MDKNPCPLCNSPSIKGEGYPHERYHGAVQIIAAFHALTGGLSQNGTWAGKDAGQWAYSARQWLLKEPE